MNGKLYINGAWVSGHGASFPSHNPANGALLWEGAAASEADVHHAVEAARAAFPAWAKLGFEARKALVEKFKTLVEQRKKIIGEAIAKETGKPLWDTLNEAAAMVAKVNVSIDAYHDRTGFKEASLAEFTARVRHKPHGVMAVFGPYNFPGHLPNGHIVPALLAGNTVVFKPSELTPYVAELTLECWEEAGLPKGVINLVQGERETGMALAAHPGIDGLLFTGSSDTGKILHRQFAGHPEKILALEMGGNNPLVVAEVSDLKAAAYHAIQSAYMSSGQRCSCARRIIVPVGAQGDRFIEAFAEMTKTIRVGAYDETPEPYMGPLISEREASKLMAAQEALQQGGGKTLIEMQRIRQPHPFLTPGLMDVTQVAERPDREYFGPLAQIIRVKDFDAAIAEANNTQYGLTAGLISDRRDYFERFVNEVRAGVINWNRPTTGASATAPYGGLGISGNHRPAAYYAADYCAHPVASAENEKPVIPEKPTPGVGV